MADSTTAKSRRLACVRGIAVFVAGAVLLLVSMLMLIPGPNYDYGVVFDAGSTGTRVHIYMWPHPVNSSSSPSVAEAPIYSQGGARWTMNVNPGISSFGSNPQGAAQSILPLIDYARSLVPPSKQQFTPIFLFATAGMRLLQQADPAASDAVLNAVRGTFAASGFLYNSSSQVRIISGQEEGLFGWVTTNYALGLLGSSTPVSNTVGLLDLGGASTQIAFVTSNYTGASGLRDAPTSDYVTLTLLGRQYTVYAVSFLGFGAEVTRQRVNTSLPVQGGLIRDPCVNSGYQQAVQSGTLTGTGNYTGCDALMDSVALNRTGDSGINGATLPALRGLFFAVSSFQYTRAFFGLPSDASIASLQAATRQYCALTWAEVQAQYPDPATAAFLDTYCFLGTYSGALLHRGFGFNPLSTQQLRFADSVGGVAAGWALGAMTYEAGLLPWRTPQADPAAPLPLLASTAGLAVGAAGTALVLLAALLLFWPRPGILPAETEYARV